MEQGDEDDKKDDTAAPPEEEQKEDDDSSSSSSSRKGKNKRATPSFATAKMRRSSFDPFPTLARDYDAALARARRSSGVGGGSYANLARLREAMHAVEPQPEGRLYRVYMCETAAARFQSGCLRAAGSRRKGNGRAQTTENRCALLLGTVRRERKKPRRARTSLSSTTEEEQFGEVARVQAVWEPSSQKPSNKHYDRDCLQPIPANVLRVAQWLGLQPVGWIFSYDGTREPDRTGGDALPVWAADVDTGARLQVANMQRAAARDDDDSSSSSSSSNGSRFVTLAMDASSGGTEAFQLSDVAVQMVAEHYLLPGDDSQPKASGRYCPTRHPVLVDGKETSELDSVLCLVNTALLSHEGLYAGSGSTKKGRLTSKARKALLRALDSDDHRKLLETLCDFELLLVLDDLLSASDSERLCQIVRKYAQGRKRTVAVDESLRHRIRTLLE